MPRLSAWLIRTALIYLAVGLTFGSLLLAQKGVTLHPVIWRLLPAHIEFVLLGWTLQLAFGVAYWILPRLAHGPRRGNERLAWLAYLALNTGVLLAGLGPVVGLPPIAILVGRAAEVMAAVLFAANAWPRVKPLGV
jgi:hypothetical protein